LCHETHDLRSTPGFTRIVTQLGDDGLEPCTAVSSVASFDASHSLPETSAPKGLVNELVVPRTQLPLRRNCASLSGNSKPNCVLFLAQQPPGVCPPFTLKDERSKRWKKQADMKTQSLPKKSNRKTPSQKTSNPKDYPLQVQDSRGWGQSCCVTEGGGAAEGWDGVQRSKAGKAAAGERSRQPHRPTHGIIGIQMRRSERNRGQERQLPGERAVSTAGPYPATGSVPMGTAQRRRWGGGDLTESINRPVSTFNVSVCFMGPDFPWMSVMVSEAQSSTESAQDAYMDGQGPRGDIISQSGLSNSTESLDSMKALTAAIEAANAQIHGPASQHVGNNSATVTTTTAIATVTTDDRKKDHFKKNRCLSIGIQVDDAEEPDKPGENKAPSKFQSVGVQVEEEKWFTRSNSVTTAVQADLDFHDNLENSLESLEDTSCPGPVARQFSRDASTSTVSIQGSGNHYHACAADEDFDADFDPSILPPPDPWIDSITEDPLEAVQRSVCHRDGHWFLKLLQAERDRMEGWCQQMEREERENSLPEDILGKIRTAVGSAQLLMAQKFYQFRELCEENLNLNAHPRPTYQDLAGFWDMLQLSIENISMKFDELHQLKANNWKQMDPLDKKTGPYQSV
ncbi:disks large-associated protein 1 isoform 2, partial [Camelus ferus]